MIYHVIPINDLSEHVEDAGNCNCKPELIIENGSMIFIHNSFDGREGIELYNEMNKDDHGNR
jgi:hypothetical protein